MARSKGCFRKDKPRSRKNFVTEYDDSEDVEVEMNVRPSSSEDDGLLGVRGVNGMQLKCEMMRLSSTSKR